jgi:hypothetical protein
VPCRPDGEPLESWFPESVAALEEMRAVEDAVREIRVPVFTNSI